MGALNLQEPTTWAAPPVSGAVAASPAFAAHALDGAAGLDAISVQLLNAYQHGFPLCQRPFAQLGAQLGLAEADVLARYRQLLAQGRISRIGPVFAPQRVGQSTLVAMRVPAQRLEEVAWWVSRHVEVNHNYEREGAYNLWFVVTAADAARLQAVLDDISGHTGLAVMPLPLLEAYHIDLGFCLLHGRSAAQVAQVSAAKAQPGQPEKAGQHGPHGQPAVPRAAALAADDPARALVAAVQGGLPLVDQPYSQVAAQLGWPTERLIAQLQAWLDAGVLKRWGVVVRHHEAGWAANAMLVHDVPDAQVSALGQRLGAHHAVSLAYRRPRGGADWPFNLYAMLHGRSRAQVEQAVCDLRLELGLQTHAHAVLFSRRRFKQTGAHYA